MTQAQNRALAALLQCKSREEAAKMAGISSRTLRNYFQNQEFAEAYRLAISELLENAVMEARQGISPALSTLREIVEDAEESAPARIAASRAALEYALKLGDAVEIEQRITQLEKMLAEVERNR